MANRKDPNAFTQRHIQFRNLYSFTRTHSTGWLYTYMYGDKMWNNKNEQMKTIATIKAIQCAMQNAF